MQAVPLYLYTWRPTKLSSVPKESMDEVPAAPKNKVSPRAPASAIGYIDASLTASSVKW